MKTVGNWVNYDYAPGLPSYGLPGMQGNAGKMVIVYFIRDLIYIAVQRKI